MSICVDIPRMPSWLRKELPREEKTLKNLTSFLESRSIETVCINSRCPNISECYSTGNVSFLILGNVCTRNCLFCAIKGGSRPAKISEAEVTAIKEAVCKLKLKYAVITSPTRDDIPDGGAGHYRKVVGAIKKESPETIVEALVPDFNGSREAIDETLTRDVDVFSHNMEMVESLYCKIRPDFDYERSLEVLRYAASSKKVIVKSGFMLGLGEKEAEVEKLLLDIKDTGASFLTIGQYLRPRGSALEVREYIHPEKFIELKEKALRLGFKKVASGPFVRSSYKALEMFKGECYE